MFICKEAADCLYRHRGIIWRDRRPFFLRDCSYCTDPYVNPSLNVGGVEVAAELSMVKEWRGGVRSVAQFACCPPMAPYMYGSCIKQVEGNGNRDCRNSILYLGNVVEVIVLGREND